MAVGGRGRRGHVFVSFACSSSHVWRWQLLSVKKERYMTGRHASCFDSKIYRMCQVSLLSQIWQFLVFRLRKVSFLTL